MDMVIGLFELKMLDRIENFVHFYSGLKGALTELCLIRAFGCGLINGSSFGS
jgi:hypothetical protein